MSLRLDTQIKNLTGVGEVRSKQFAALGLYSVGALLRYYPFRYEDWSNTVTIYDAPFDGLCCIRAKVAAAPKELRTKGGRTLYKLNIADGTGALTVTFFNNKYIKDMLTAEHEYLFYGKVTESAYGAAGMLSPEFIPAAQGGGIRPVYSRSGTLNSRFIEKCVRESLRLVTEIPEVLPEWMIKKYRLPSLDTALRSIHFPENADSLAQAKRRLIFEELLTLEMGLMVFRNGGDKKTAAAFKTDYTGEFLSRLPFTPTGAQCRTVAECAHDTCRDVPMNRLLSGDVGSGKTAVAAALMYSAAKNGMQSVIMAPTEVLASQHLRTLTGFFEGTGIVTELLTGSTPAKEKKRIKSQLESGEIDVLVGTHAVIQKDVSFRALGLAVTDEQHRFGVNQRGELTRKGTAPHVLVMSATPIPRTLAMIVYGDLDVSVLDELPGGRKPVETYKVGTQYRGRIYSFIKKQVEAGRQGFIVCPLVEEGESDLVPAVQYRDYLAQSPFKGCRVGLLHGQMKPRQKEKVMAQVLGGEIDVLVSTVVIEVGIDIPNATVMMIENAERFGLSQLHQLRGRIGRGEHKSTCILVSDAENPEAEERFKIMCETTDGFKIADKDLELRGPGDFFGSRQHGLPDLHLADLCTDTNVLYEAQRAAKYITGTDPLLELPEHEGLRREVERLFETVTFN